jgi:hypothetical protein
MTGKLNEETYECVRDAYDTSFDMLNHEVKWENIQHCMVFLDCCDGRYEVLVRVEYLCRYVLP